MTLIVSKSIPSAAIPIVAVDAATWAAFEKRADKMTRHWLAANAFQPEPQRHCIVPDGKGGIAEVVVAVAPGDDPYVLSGLPLKLPPGRYRLAENGRRLEPYWAALSWTLGGYQYTRYKAAKRAPAELHLVAEAAVARAVHHAAAICQVRDWVSTPAQDMGPDALADAAAEVARVFKAKIKVIAGDALLAKNFPAIHAVGRAADRAPRLIELQWGKPGHPLVAIAGKGVCFDTGGLNIKTGDYMRLMKKDMGGAANALGLAQLIMQEALPLRLQLLIPAVENAVSGNAFRPGDVLKTRSGRTVEIGNTDAEGRLVLADALAYAGEGKPDLLLDFATLTGAARVALGPELPAMFSNDETWAASLLEHSRQQCDPLWRMPLWQPYHGMLDSDIADTNNVGGSYAGAITAALFLQRFVPAATAWCHVDLFAYNASAKPGRPVGGEAQTIRAVLAALRARYVGRTA
jgi:leucyl aminopeptidase